MAQERSDTTDREIVISRLINAPRTAVWEAWTKAEHLAQWWGPDGFSIPDCEVDFRVGGAFRMVMRGPDGTDYPFVNTYREITEPEQIVFTGTIDEASGQELVTTVRFTETDGKTTITVRQTVPVVEAYARGQVQGWTETLARLDEFVAAKI